MANIFSIDGVNWFTLLVGGYRFGDYLETPSGAVFQVKNACPVQFAYVPATEVPSRARILEVKKYDPARGLVLA